MLVFVKYKEGRYFASLAESPETEASADSLYEAIEELERITNTSTLKAEQSDPNNSRNNLV